MAAQIPDSHRDLLEQPVVVGLVTVMPDGQPQATPVWCDFDGQHIIVNTARGRQKDRNMQRNPHVTVLAIDPKNPYRYLEVRGQVVEATEEGGIEVINRLSEKYTGQSDYYAGMPERRAKERRVTYKIRPVRVVAWGN
mgnify:FL=1